VGPPPGQEKVTYRKQKGKKKKKKKRKREQKKTCKKGKVRKGRGSAPVQKKMWGRIGTTAGKRPPKKKGLMPLRRQGHPESDGRRGIYQKKKVRNKLREKKMVEAWRVLLTKGKRGRGLHGYFVRDKPNTRENP